MRRWGLILALVVVAAAGGWMWGSPYLAVRAMEKAAEARDEGALSARVDYPALRQSVKAQLRARVSNGRDTAEGTLFDALVASGLAEGLVDAAVTPEGVRLMFASGAADATRAHPPAALDARKMALRRDAPDRFRLVSTDSRGGALVFALRGFDWKLVGIELPRDASPRG